MADIARWENEGGAFSRPTTADASDEAKRVAADAAATEGATTHGGRSETSGSLPKDAEHAAAL